MIHIHSKNAVYNLFNLGRHLGQQKTIGISERVPLRPGERQLPRRIGYIGVFVDLES